MKQTLEQIMGRKLCRRYYSEKVKKKWREDETNLLFWAVDKISKLCSLLPSQLV